MLNAVSPPSRRTLTPAKAVAVILLTVVAMLVAGPSPAEAGTCGTPGCGGVLYNESSRTVMVTNCWTSGSFYNGTYPPCTGGEYCYGCTSAYYGRTGGGNTYSWPTYYDVDAFRADAGCYTAGFGTRSGTFGYDQRSINSHRWVRFSSIDRIYITSVTCNR